MSVALAAHKQAATPSNKQQNRAGLASAPICRGLHPGGKGVPSEAVRIHFAPSLPAPVGVQVFYYPFR